MDIGFECNIRKHKWAVRAYLFLGITMKLMM